MKFRSRLALAAGGAALTLAGIAPAAVATTVRPPTVSPTVTPASSEDPPICVYIKAENATYCYSTEPTWNLISDIVHAIRGPLGV